MTIRLRRLAPEPKSTLERVRVRAQPSVRRQFVETLGVAAAEDDILDAKCLEEHGGDSRDVTAPRPLSELPKPGVTQVLLVGPAVGIRKVRELERNEHFITDHRGTQAGPKTEKQHAAAGVAPE